jgi:hypothetical protein
VFRARMCGKPSLLRPAVATRLPKDEEAAVAASTLIGLRKHE